MPKISDIHSLEILDSRGNPTLETTVLLDTGVEASAAVPSGASTGSHEAVELRDADPKRYHGKGVLKAIGNVTDRILPKIRGMDITAQKEIDQAMIALDGTDNKASLGANAILSVSLAVCRAAALSEKMPLYAYISHLSNLQPTTHNSQLSFPTPMFNILNGGLHAGMNIDIQECMILPDRRIAYPDGLRMGSEIYHALKQTLHGKGHGTNVGDEGGFAPVLQSNREAVQLLKDTIQNTAYAFGTDVSIGMDIASSSFLDGDRYKIKDSPAPLSREEFIHYLLDLQKEFQILSLEDPLMEDDWEGWKQFMSQVPATVRVVGDDLLCTNPKRLQKAIEAKACNSILVKVNQIGSLSETLAVIAMAKEAGWTVIVSHRSGETTDDFISDLAVGVSADYVKFGAPCRGERVAKYNRLLHIYTVTNS